MIYIGLEDRKNKVKNKFDPDVHCNIHEFFHLPKKFKNYNCYSYCINFKKHEYRLEIDIHGVKDRGDFNIVNEKCRKLFSEKEWVIGMLLWTSDDYKYWHCRDIEDIPELWKAIKKDSTIVEYCKWVKDRKELWEKLNNDIWIYDYLKDVKDREELWTKLKQSWSCYDYCVNIEDRPEVRQNIVSKEWQKEYLMWKTNKGEITLENL